MQLIKANHTSSQWCEPGDGRKRLRGWRGCSGHAPGQTAPSRPECLLAYDAGLHERATLPNCNHWSRSLPSLRCYPSSPTFTWWCLHNTSTPAPTSPCGRVLLLLNALSPEPFLHGEEGYGSLPNACLGFASPGTRNSLRSFPRFCFPRTARAFCDIFCYRASISSIAVPHRAYCH